MYCQAKYSGGKLCIVHHSHIASTACLTTIPADSAGNLCIMAALTSKALGIAISEARLNRCSFLLSPPTQSPFLTAIAPFGVGMIHPYIMINELYFRLFKLRLKQGMGVFLFLFFPNAFGALGLGYGLGPCVCVCVDNVNDM